MTEAEAVDKSGRNAFSYADRVERSMGGYRGRVLAVVEDYVDTKLPEKEMEDLKRRIRQITSDVWDEMRRVVHEMEKAPTPEVVLVRIEERLGTLENQVLVGGPGTVVHRLAEIEKNGTGTSSGV